MRGLANDGAVKLKDHGFEVIDVHQHLSHEALGEVHRHLHVERNIVFEGPARSSGDSGESPMSLELRNRLDALDAEHVGGAVIIPIHGYLRPRGVVDTVAMNDAVAAYRARAPQRFIGAVGVVEPIHGPSGYGEIRRCRDELGFVGVSTHGQVPTNSLLMRRLIGKIGEAGLVPFVHCFGSYNETIAQVDSLAGVFPDLPMLVLDVFHEQAQVSLLPEVAARRPKLIFDLSSSLNFEVMGLPQIRAVGVERFLYGTNMHSLPLHTKPFGTLLPEILASGLTSAEKTAILSGNARRLLGL
jgi:predicted TIM-barrel fold metal-dependent hydrolase